MKFNEETLQLEGEVEVETFDNIKDKSKVINWLCSKEILKNKNKQDEQ